jgi:hypothetical protein
MYLSRVSSLVVRTSCEGVRESLSALSSSRWASQPIASLSSSLAASATVRFLIPRLVFLIPTLRLVNYQRCTYSYSLFLPLRPALCPSTAPTFLLHLEV